ncbi:MAG: proton-conducting transporter membrane subunit, partial [Planctomycetaceae bacterium]
MSPAILLVGLGVPSLLGKPLSERLTDRLGQTTIWTGLLASIAVLVWMLSTDQTHLLLVGRNWVEIPGYHFAFKLVFDRLSVPFVILSFLLCGTIGAFAARYLHREPGFNRFFVLFSFFLLGMVVTSLAGTIETLFAGWELVGLSSALLVAFYHDRLGPVSNGLHVWSVYRFSDAALLLASVVLHHLTGEGDFDQLFRTEGNWPFGTPALASDWATIVGFLLAIAAAGKSALIPFSGWLPRAMEGPTPSSAVFYGALSVHLGAYLLLRVSPLMDASPLLCAALVVLG